MIPAIALWSLLQKWRSLRSLAKANCVTPNFKAAARNTPNTGLKGLERTALDSSDCPCHRRDPPDCRQMISNGNPTTILWYTNKILLWFHTSKEKRNSSLNGTGEPESVDSLKKNTFDILFLVLNFYFIFFFSKTHHTWSWLDGVITAHRAEAVFQTAAGCVCSGARSTRPRPLTLAQLSGTNANKTTQKLQLKDVCLQYTSVTYCDSKKCNNMYCL